MLPDGMYNEDESEQTCHELWAQEPHLHLWIMFDSARSTFQTDNHFGGSGKDAYKALLQERLKPSSHEAKAIQLGVLVVRLVITFRAPKHF
jgi:hypothetical protein